MRKRTQRGATTVEMTLVGLPIIFILISIFEIARGMWVYDTAAHAARQAVRYATVHGKNCVNNPPTVTNNCSVTAADVVGVVRNAAVGLDPNTTSVTLRAGASAPVTCYLSGTGCPATVWPPDSYNEPGQPIDIRVAMPFQSALAMFWPGAGKVSFAAVTLGATSSDLIQF